MTEYLNNYNIEEDEYTYDEVDESVNMATDELIKKVLSELDYENKDYDFRKKRIEDIYEKYWHEMDTQFSYYQESNLNKYINKKYYDELSEMYNALSNYLLFSDNDLPKTEYNFYKNDNIKDGSVSEISLETIIKNEIRHGDGIENEVKKYYDDYNHANYSIKKIKHDIESCPYAQDYVKGNEIIRDIVKKHDEYYELQKKTTLTEVEQLKKNMLESEIEYTEQQINVIKRSVGYSKNNSKEIDKDIISVVKEYMGYIYFKSPLKESEVVDWDEFDYDNKEHVLALLRFNGRGNFGDDLKILLYDFNKIVNKTRFSRKENEIIKLWKDEMSQVDIADTLNVTPQYVNATLNRIANKITDTFWNEYEDWYYTYVVKGKYKKCIRCNEVKLIKHFGKDTRNNDGLKNYCKDCN